jgi:hypothetical protein
LFVTQAARVLVRMADRCTNIICEEIGTRDRSFRQALKI